MSERFERIPLERIVPSPFNPRKTFDAVALGELAHTIREHGVLEPAVVRTVGEGYELVMGERRLRASALAKIPDLPCLVREYTDEQVLEVIVIENNQRADVNAAEESMGFAAILAQPRYQVMGRLAAVREVARKLGRSERYVFQRLALERLTDEARGELLAGHLTPSHAVVLARLTPEVQAAMLTEHLHETKWQGGDVGYVRAGRREDGPRYSVREFERMAARRAGVPLARAPFALDDPFRGVGRDRPCDGCPARTTTDPSADERVVDACGDEGCFMAKCAAHVERRLAEEAEAHGKPLVRLSLLYRTDAEGVQGTEKWTGVKPDAKGARPSIVVEATNDFARLGEILHTVRAGTSGLSPEEEKARKAEEAEKARRMACERDFRESLMDGIGRGAREAGVGATLLRLVAAMLRERVYSEVSAKAAATSSGLWPGEAVKRGAKAEAWAGLDETDLAAYVATLLAAPDFETQSWNFEKTPKGLLDVARAYGLDVDAIRKEAYGQRRLFDGAVPEAPPELPPTEAPEASLFEGAYLDLPADKRKADPAIVPWAKTLAIAAEMGAEVPVDMDAFFELMDAIIDGDDDALRKGLESQSGAMVRHIPIAGRRLVSSPGGAAYRQAVLA